MFLQTMLIVVLQTVIDGAWWHAAVFVVCGWLNGNYRLSDIKMGRSVFFFDPFPSRAGHKQNHGYLKAVSPHHCAAAVLSDRKHPAGCGRRAVRTGTGQGSGRSHRSGGSHGAPHWTAALQERGSRWVCVIKPVVRHKCFTCFPGYFAKKVFLTFTLAASKSFRGKKFPAALLFFFILHWRFSPLQTNLCVAADE